jgi:hypothetical protein
MTVQIALGALGAIALLATVVLNAVSTEDPDTYAWRLRPWVQRLLRKRGGL